MKRLLLLIALMFSPALVVFAQTPLFPMGYTAATLPAASTMPKRVVVVTDDTSPGQCGTTGGGTARTWCYSTGSAWIPLGDGLGTGGGAVNSFNGRSGVVLPVAGDYSKSDVGLGNVDNTSDVTKFTAPTINSPVINVIYDSHGNAYTYIHGNGPRFFDITTGKNLTLNVQSFTAHRDWAFPNVSDTFVGVTAPQTLTFKTLTAPVINSPTGIVKGDVGLVNVDNTSDVNKPVSTAQAAADALNLKIGSNLSDLANPGTARTNLGATTVGIGFFTFTNPSAIRFPRVEVDNSVTGRTAAQLLSDIGAVPTTRTITEGAGLAGNTYDFSLNRTLALGTPSTLTVSTTNSAGGTTHSHAITSSSNPGAAASLLASNASGYLQLTRLGLGMSPTNTLDVTGTFGVTSTATVGADILPLVNYTSNLGALATKYLTLHVAELWSETLVAQNTLATIGGRVLVAPTTPLTADLAAGGTTVTVKYNNLANGDRIYLEANGKVEFMAVTSSAGGSAGAYTYTVTRDLDGSGANQWYAGDAALDTGTTGNGFIDLYSVAGVIPGSTVGPTIVGNIRTGTTYNNIEPRWAIGNLNGLYGYSGSTYGAAFGTPTGAWLKIDPANGIRIGNNATTLGQWDASGVLTLGQVAAGKSNTLISAGALSIRLNTTGLFGVDTSGNVRIGTDISAAASTNLFVSNASQTYNSEAGFVAGDILIGNNTSASNYGNIKITGGGIKIRRGVTDYITINSTDAQFTNLIKMSGSSAAIAIGSTPPTSASAGTGIWLERTGMYGLASGAQQFKIDATTGTFTAGNSVTISSSGIFAGVGGVTIGMTGTSSSDGLILTATNIFATLQLSPRVRMTAIDDQLYVFSDFYRSIDFIQEVIPTGSGAAAWTLSHQIQGGSGYLVGLKSDMSGNLSVTGLIKAGSSPTTLTDATGKLLTAAFADQWFDQSVKVAATPQFARLGVGNAADANIKITITPVAYSTAVDGIKFLNRDNSRHALLQALQIPSGGMNFAQMSNCYVDTAGAFQRFDTAQASAYVNVRGDGHIYFGTGDTSAVASLRMDLGPTGGLQIGSPTGGDRGVGTVNAQALYDDNVLLTDWVFDPAHAPTASRRLFDLSETRSYVVTEHRLPWMPTPSEFESARSLGGMTTRLWQGQEQQQLYIFQLEERIKKLEQQKGNQ